MDDHDLAPKATKHDFGTCGGSFRLSHDPALPFSAWNPKSGIERNACEALRNPECDGLLLPAAPDVRPCGGGAISEDREPGVGVGVGPACRPTASTGGVASGARGEVAGSEDEVKSATLPLFRPNNLCPVGVGLSSLAANREFPNRIAPYPRDQRSENGCNAGDSFADE